MTCDVYLALFWYCWRHLCLSLWEIIAIVVFFFLPPPTTKALPTPHQGLCSCQSRQPCRRCSPSQHPAFLSTPPFLFSFTLSQPSHLIFFLLPVSSFSSSYRLPISPSPSSITNTAFCFPDSLPAGFLFLIIPASSFRIYSTYPKDIFFPPFRFLFFFFTQPPFS